MQKGARELLEETKWDPTRSAAIYKRRQAPPRSNAEFSRYVRKSALFCTAQDFADRARLLGRRDAVQCALSLAGAIVLFALWMAALGSLGTRQRSPIEHLLHTAKPTLGLD